jgi:hypothetical protein
MSQPHGPPADATLLGMPEVPARSTTDDGPVRFGAGHHFTLAPGASLDDLVASRAQAALWASLHDIPHHDPPESSVNPSTDSPAVALIGDAAG